MSNVSLRSKHKSSGAYEPSKAGKRRKGKTAPVPQPQNVQICSELLKLSENLINVQQQEDVDEDNVDQAPILEPPTAKLDLLAEEAMAALQDESSLEESVA